MSNAGSTTTSLFRFFFFEEYKDNEYTHPLLTIVLKKDNKSGSFDVAREETYDGCSFEFDFGLRDMLKNMIKEKSEIIMKHPLIIRNQERDILYCVDLCVPDHKSKSFNITLSRLLEGTYSLESSVNNPLFGQGNGNKTQYIRFISGDNTYRIPTDIDSIKTIRIGLLYSDNPIDVLNKFIEPQQSIEVCTRQTSFHQVSFEVKGSRYTLFTEDLEGFTMRDLEEEDIKEPKPNEVFFNGKYLNFYYIQFLRENKAYPEDNDYSESQVYSIAFMEFSRNNNEHQLIQVSRKMHVKSIRKNDNKTYGGISGVLENWNKKNQNIVIIEYNKELALKTIYPPIYPNYSSHCSLDILNMLTQRFQFLNYVKESELGEFSENTELSLEYIKSLIKERSITPGVMLFDIVKKDIKVLEEKYVNKDVNELLRQKFIMFFSQDAERLRKKVRKFLEFTRDVFSFSNVEVARKMEKMMEMEIALKDMDHFKAMLSDLSDLLVSSFSSDVSKQPDSFEGYTPSM